MKGQRVHIGILFILILLIGCTSAQQTQVEGNQVSKLDLIATFYPLYDITKKIAGEQADVQSIVPSGVEPHDYEPTPSDILKLSNAKAFVTIGLEFSGIEEKLIEGSKNKLLVIDSKKGITLQGEDTHIWLSPKNMIIMSMNIMDGLNKIDPKNSNLYEENAKKLIEELKALDSDYKTGLANCKKHVVIANHGAFAYLGKDYGFRQIGIFGLAPETEPTPQDLVNIKNEAEKNNVAYIFSEELVEQRIAQTIANEIKAKVLVLNPIEGTKSPSEDYFSLMRQNLANLKLAMECN